MGNQQLIRILSDIAVTDIKSRGVSFQDGLLSANAIFQRHNYQLYSVNCPIQPNPLGWTPSQNFTMRVIRCLNDAQSIEILKKMQNDVVSLKQHPYLTKFYIMALVPENFNEKQKAGFIGLPGLYKSVAGTTDYKNDTIQFILVEEDHLLPLPQSFWGIPDPENENIKAKFTLKQFMDRILQNSLLIELFTSDQTILHQIIIQSLQALAFLNEQGMTHQDLSPQNMIFELISPHFDAQGNPKDLSPQAINDFHHKFKVKLGEYLNIKTLSDIAYQKTIVTQTQAQLAQQQRMGMKNTPSAHDIIKQIRENKQLYSQYEPPEKLQIQSIVLKQKGDSQSDNLEDFDVQIMAQMLENQNCDVWSLGIIVLEIFLSLYIHKKDCREMVHNLYLNKMTYQSRCIILNEILQHKQNPIFCSLIKEMLRDPSPMTDQEYLFEEENFYEELVSKTSKKSLRRQGRPSAAQLLTKNRIVHYFSYISDNVIEDQHLPQDINLLQEFSSNQIFVPMLIQCGLQNIMNKNKSIITFFSLMTLFIKNKESPRNGVNNYIIRNLVETKAFIQMIELMNFCMSSDLKPIMIFFNQNLLNQSQDFRDFGDINEQLFQADFKEQKTVCLEILNLILSQSKNGNFQLYQEFINAGLVPLMILLIQRIKNQKWMRERNSKSIGYPEIEDPMTEQTLSLIETIANFSEIGGAPKTLIRFIDKIEFFTYICDVIFNSKSNESNDVNFSEKDEQIPNTQAKQSQRRYSQKRKTASALGDALDDGDKAKTSYRHNHGSVSHAKSQMYENFDNGGSVDSETRKTFNDSMMMTDEQKLRRAQRRFKDRLFQFVIKCTRYIQESNLQKIIDQISSSKASDCTQRQLTFLSSSQMKSVALNCSYQFKQFVVAKLMKKFLSIHLKSNKMIAPGNNPQHNNSQYSFKEFQTKQDSNTNNILSPKQATTIKGNGPKREIVNLEVDNEFLVSGTLGNNKTNQQSQRNLKSTRKEPPAQVPNGPFNIGPEPTPSKRRIGSRKGSFTAGSLSESENQLCQITKILSFFIDIQHHISNNKLLQLCISEQNCLSTREFPIRDHFVESNLDQKSTALAKKQSYIDFTQGSINMRQQSPTNTQVQEQKDGSSRLSNSNRSIQQVFTEQSQILSSFFFQCGECSNRVYCIVCALKFHQDHKNIQPYLNTTRDSDRFICSTQKSIDVPEDQDYINQNFVWSYDMDQYSDLKAINHFEKELYNFASKNSNSKSRGQKSSQQNPSKVQQQYNSGFSFQNQLRQGSNLLQRRESSPGTGNDQQSGVNYVPSKIEFESIINLDLFDPETVFTEHKGTHFLTNDFEQHSLISSTPLEIPQSSQHAPNPQQFLQNYSQSYFEIKIHSGGFYDQIQVGLLFVLQQDIQRGFNSSSSVLNTAKNKGIIPGYEPLSIGYHGDNGNIFHNLSKNVCLEQLIKRAQQDSEQLLEEADTDTSLFDISNQVVYGGTYGPPYGSTDSIGCGIIPPQRQGQDEVTIYFTRNGMKLPGLKIKSLGIKLFPIVSMKGKLCHIEMIKNVRSYAHNIAITEEKNLKLLTQNIKQNEKFMRSLVQFNQILSLRLRRNQSQSNIWDNTADKGQSERSRSEYKRKGLKAAPESLIKVINRLEKPVELTKMHVLQPAKSLKNLGNSNQNQKQNINPPQVSDSNSQRPSSNPRGSTGQRLLQAKSPFSGQTTTRNFASKKGIINHNDVASVKSNSRGSNLPPTQQYKERLDRETKEKFEQNNLNHQKSKESLQKIQNASQIYNQSRMRQQNTAMSNSSFMQQDSVSGRTGGGNTKRSTKNFVKSNKMISSKSQSKLQ